MSGIPLSLDRKFVSLMRMKHSGGSKLQPYLLRVGLTSKPSKVQRVQTRGEGTDGKVSALKTAAMRLTL